MQKIFGVTLKIFTAVVGAGGLSGRWYELEPGGWGRVRRSGFRVAWPREWGSVRCRSEP